MHVGTNPGAPTGKAHGNYRSGIWTKEWLKLRREASVPPASATDNPVGDRMACKRTT